MTEKNGTLTDTEILEQIEMLIEDGRVPKAEEFRDHPDTCSLTNVEWHFGSWRAAVNELGYEPHRVVQSKEEIINDVRMLAMTFGRIPLLREFDECPFTCGEDTLAAKVGGWEEAVRMADIGHLPRKDTKPIQTELNG